MRDKCGFIEANSRPWYSRSYTLASSDQTLLSGLRTIDDIILIEHGKNICRHKLLDLYNLSVVATRGGPVTAQPNSSCGTGLGLGS